MVAYYADKGALLGRILGVEDVRAEGDWVIAGQRRYPVVDDVIIALPPERIPASVRRRLPPEAPHARAATPFAEDIQHGFGAEWTAFPDVLPSHRDDFLAYFDLVDLDGLAGKVVADLGCGSGRWATFVAARGAQLIAVDYSEAIFVARRNLSGSEGVFVMADVLDLPFAADAFDFAYCLGVLHHLPVDALSAVDRLLRHSPALLVYLYYALDKRPWHFRALLRAVSALRTRLAAIRAPRTRQAIATLIAAVVYVPLAALGRLLRPLGAARWLPLAETYAGQPWRTLRTDAYDRFFTSIEQRFSRDRIESLHGPGTTVTVSDQPPYWHFLLTRTEARSGVGA